jgi:uncharacterized protein
LLIAKEEVCNETIVKLAALLHDIADSKFNNGDEVVGRKQRGLLESEDVDGENHHVIKIIENISYKG